MSAFLILTLTGLASTSVLLTVTGIALFRNGLRALAYWLFAWSALIQGGLATLLVPHYPEIAPITPIFSSFVAPFMLLGALAHTERADRLWLILASFVLAVTRVSAYLVGARDFAISIAIATEPMLAFVAAWVMLQPPHGSKRKLVASDYALAVGFALYGGVEFFDAVSHARDSFGWANWIAWVAIGVPLASTQIYVHLDRIGRSARRHEDAARANAMRLEMLAQSPQDFLSEVDERGLLTWVSPGAAVATGRPVEALIGRNVLEFLAPSSDSMIWSKLTAHGRLTTEDAEEAAGTSHLAILPDGSRRWYEFLATSYRTLSGDLRFVTRTRDVTARAEQELILRRSEARLRRAEQIGRVGSWELDLESNEMVFSDEMVRIHGIDPGIGPITREMTLGLVHPDDLASARRTWARVRELGEPEEQLFRIVRANDGAIRNLRVLTEADRDAEGRVVRLVGATFDITEQIALTDQLRQDQQRFRSLVDSNIVSVYFAHRDGPITEANDAFLSLLGYTKEDLPLDWRDLTAPEHRREDADRAAAEDPSRLAQPFEKDFLTRDGRRIPMLLSFAQLSADTSILIGVDLRERKQAEAYRAQYQKELEETIATRTRELVESRSRLIEHDRLVAVGTLAAGVAHQINNPIGAILNCAEYALMCRDDEEVLEIYERALRDNLAEARRCAQIVRSMLQFSREQPTAKWVEDLNRVARRAHRAVHPLARERGASVSITTTDDAMLIRMSPIELEQAILNVVHNAIESRESGAKVSIVLARRDKTATIEVVDDGRGIAPEHQDRIFEPFFSTRTRAGGTGLGLSVTHGVVVDHGGQVRIESVPGVGTRVLISLPIEE
ncbi:MAG: PAS domain S-box protein [Deltaproteobacteria bacterium]|nr:PAS domain S-box protein [Deltaproteobacteria bacterium]